MMDSTMLALQERKLTNAYALHLPDNQKTYWEDYHHIGRFHFHPDDTLEVLEHDQPLKCIASLKPYDVAIHFDTGLEVCLRDKDGQQHWFGHAPHWVQKFRLFLWIPSVCSDVRFHKTQDIHQLSLNLAFKSAHAPGYKVPGNTYITKVL